MIDVRPYAKAITAAALAVSGAIGASYSEHGSLTTVDVVRALLAGLAAGMAVYAVPNKDPEAQHQDESVQPADVDVDPATSPEPAPYIGKHEPTPGPADPQADGATIIHMDGSTTP